MIVLQVIGIVIGIFILYLLIVSIIPGFSVRAQPLEKSARSTREADAKSSRSRTDVSFKVKGTSLSAWLYLPKDLSDPVPCIVMAHGLGGTKDAGLGSYATHFQEAGFAVLAFDYRHWGESGGEPRQLIWTPYQLEDYRAAIDYARSLEEIDQARIALWGTSFSGGHVIVTAAKDKDIACAVAQCPWLDGLAAAKAAAKMQSVGRGLRLIMHGQRDIVRSYLGLSPHTIPIVGKSGSTAILAFSEAYEAFEKLVPGNFINEACARIMIRMDKYRPIKKAKKVRCPVLLQICDKDEPLPMSVIEEAANQMGEHSEVKHYPIGHFDIYIGSNFEKSVCDQLEFFTKHLLSQ